MKRVLAAALAVGLCAGQAAAQDDDWEFQEDAAQGVSVAAVRYDAGQMIVVQCRQGTLTTAVTGLPPSAEPLRFAATRADGRRAAQIWVSVGTPDGYRSVSPGRDARFLRGGGTYVVRTGPDAPAAVNGTFDLPSQSANLDRVLTACGWTLEDDRDLLAEADEIFLDRPRRGRAEARPYRPPAIPEREVSCVVREMRLRDCRADHPAYARTSDARSLIRSVEGRRVYVADGVDAVATDGKVFHVMASHQLLVVVHR